MENIDVEKILDEVKENNIQPVDNKSEEDAIYYLSETEGWKIMMKKYHKKIAELLEPIQHADVSEVKDLVLIGAMAIARREKIDALTEFVSEVESVNKARKEMEKRNQPIEESKSEA